MTKQSSLERVQNLLILQTEIFNLLDEDLSDPAKNKEAKKTVKEFNVLLSEVDMKDLSYLGVQEEENEDILQGFKEAKKEISSKLKDTPVKKGKK